MTTSPRFAFTDLEQNTNGVFIYNRMVHQMELFLGGIVNVLDTQLLAEPGSPSNGDIYYVDGTATGTNWAGNADDSFAWRDAGTWYYFSPFEGQMMYDRSDNKYRSWDGSTLQLAFERDYNLRVGSPGSSEDIVLAHTQTEVEIQELASGVRGTSSPDVTWTLRYGTDRSAAGTEVVTGGHTTNNTTTADTITSFNNGTVPAGNFLWLETSATTGTVNEFYLTVKYRTGDI